MGQVILVTGASSGIGRAIASRLVRAGHRVFGTSRNPKSPNQDGIEMLALDVTQDESVAACVAEVIARAGKLDVLINNAGVELLGALEETHINEAKALFETNFFGVMRMVNAVLPTLRAQRSGLIINISSVAGFTSPPFQGIYSASKHALEGYSESLFYELEPFNIRVALIEPGIFNSGISGSRLQPAQQIADYAATQARVTQVWEGYIANGSAPTSVAETALKIVEGKTRRLRHVVASLDTRTGIFSKALPEGIVQFIMRRWSGLILTPFTRKHLRG